MRHQQRDVARLHERSLTEVQLLAYFEDCGFTGTFDFDKRAHVRQRVELDGAPAELPGFAAFLEAEHAQEAETRQIASSHRDRFPRRTRPRHGSSTPMLSRPFVRDDVLRLARLDVNALTERKPSSAARSERSSESKNVLVSKTEPSGVATQLRAVAPRTTSRVRHAELRFDFDRHLHPSNYPTTMFTKLLRHVAASS